MHPTTDNLCNMTSLVHSIVLLLAVGGVFGTSAKSGAHLTTFILSQMKDVWKYEVKIIGDRGSATYLAESE